MATSRLIVKNIPTYLTEDKLRDHFSKFGTVTDAKIMTKNNKSRQFAFVGCLSSGQMGNRPICQRLPCVSTTEPPW